MQLTADLVLHVQACSQGIYLPLGYICLKAYMIIIRVKRHDIVLKRIIIVELVFSNTDSAAAVRAHGDLYAFGRKRFLRLNHIIGLIITRLAV